MTKPRFLYDPYSTHQPVLYEAVLRTTGMVIEFGCGHGSTPMLHKLCRAHDRPLVTIESDKEWFDKFIQYQAPWHQFIHVLNWDVVPDDILSTHYGLAFVDQAPWEARYKTILAIQFSARFIVLHDCDYFPEHGLLGKSIKDIQGPRDVGLRTYDFKYYKEFFPLEPWPYPLTGPPTLLASNFEDCDWDIDFEKYREEELMT